MFKLQLITWGGGVIPLPKTSGKMEAFKDAREYLKVMESIKEVQIFWAYIGGHKYLRSIVRNEKTGKYKLVTRRG